MSNFEVVIPWLLYQEDSKRIPGEIVNLGDGEGQTRLGITSKVFGSIMPNDFFTTMTVTNAIQAAKTLYQTEYWHHLNGDKILHDEVAAPLLSFAVNKNIPVAVKALQRALGVLPDGVLGLVTIAELNQKDPVAVTKLFRSEWEDFYRTDVSMNPSRQRFLDGWIARVNFPYPSPLVPKIYA
jgi:lysozyme family protein